MATSDEFGKKARNSRQPATPQPQKDAEQKDDPADLAAARQEILRKHYAPSLNQEMMKKELSREEVDKQAQLLAQKMAVARQQQGSAEKMQSQARSERPAATDEEKQRRFAEWEARKRETLRAQQTDEQRTLERYQAPKREVLEKQHRLHSDSRREDLAMLAAIDERQRQGSFLSRGIDRLRGVDQQRVSLKMNIASADHRLRETRDALDDQVDMKASLDRDQMRESQKLDKQIEQAKAAGYEIPNEAAKQQRSSDRERDTWEK